MNTGKPTVDELIAYWQSRAETGMLPAARKMVEATRDYIASLSAADVAPVRHGRWILLGKNGSGVCSECNRQDYIDPLATHCKYCGALMDGKEDEHEAD